MREPTTLRQERAFRRTRLREGTRPFGPDASTLRARRREALASPSEVSRSARCKVLVVAPRSLRRERAIAMLEGHGYDVLSSTSWIGALLLAAVHSWTLDLLVTDPLLPGLGGLPLSQRIRRIVPSLPVVLTRFGGGGSHSRSDTSESPALGGPAWEKQLLEEVELMLAPRARSQV